MIQIRIQWPPVERKGETNEIMGGSTEGFNSICNVLFMQKKRMNEIGKLSRLVKAECLVSYYNFSLKAAHLQPHPFVLSQKEGKYLTGAFGEKLGIPNLAPPSSFLGSSHLQRAFALVCCCNVANQGKLCPNECRYLS